MEQLYYNGPARARDWWRQRNLNWKGGKCCRVAGASLCGAFCCSTCAVVKGRYEGGSIRIGTSLGMCSTIQIRIRIHGFDYLGEGHSLTLICFHFASVECTLRIVW